MQQKTCWVFVLGDFGRSPRMQYHTESLLNHGFQVTVIGSPGSHPLPEIVLHSEFTFIPIKQIPRWIQPCPSLLKLVLKALFQFFYLLVLLLGSLPRPDFVLVQIPPAIPTLWFCILIRVFRRIPIILDWHNFAYSIMALSKKNPVFLIKVAKWIEMRCGRWGQKHICVSRAMQSELMKFGIKATVLYDQPHERFQSADLNTRHQLLTKLRPLFQCALHTEDFCTKLYEKLDLASTFQTKDLGNGKLKFQEEYRPALVVSSTSWTIDEDFSVLLEAAEHYDEQLKNQKSQHPELIILVTGKGPMKEYYLEKMKEKRFTSVAFRTVWLEAADYPVLLGCADLGVSLHTSSSGVDLPMKVVDMFGSQLPVCSANYPAISELVHDGENGVLFSSALELSKALWDVLENFPSPRCHLLHQMKARLEKKEIRSWEEHWDEVMWPILNERQK